MDIRIDVTESDVIINGSAVRLPLKIVSLCDILGNARRTGFEFVDGPLFTEEDRQLLNGKLRNRAVFTWDDIGVICHTDDGEAVHTISVMLDGSDFIAPPAFYPEKLFKGLLTVCGKPWREQIKQGRYSGTSVELICGDNHIYAGSPIFNRAADYSTVEISPLNR